MLLFSGCFQDFLSFFKLIFYWGIINILVSGVQHDYIFIYITEWSLTSLINICHYTVTVFFLMMRTLKIYSLSSFQIYNTVLYSHHSLHFTWLTYFITRSLYLLTPFTHFAHPYLSILTTTSLFTISQWAQFCFCFFIPPINEIMQYLSFSDVFHRA